MVIAALAGAARGAAVDVWTLYAAAIATGFGVAIMQPGMPTLVREWTAEPHRARHHRLYQRHADGRDAFAPILTIPFVLPLVGGSWRLDLVVWAVPALLIAPVFLLLSPRARRIAARQEVDADCGGRISENPLVWLLGFTLRQQQQPVFRNQCLSRRLSRQQGAGRSARPGLGLAQRLADRRARAAVAACRTACSGAPGRS